jgi:hypothetical protein
MKPCTKCKLIKPLSDFGINKTKRDGHTFICKCCKSIKDKEYYNLNKSKKQQTNKVWYSNNRERKLELDKKYRESNKEYIREKHRLYAQKLRTNNYWRFNKEYYTWVQSVYKRDNYTCQDCGACNCKVNAHHIKEGHGFPELRYDVDNGVCLCVKCHRLRHS